MAAQQIISKRITRTPSRSFDIIKQNQAAESIPELDLAVADTQNGVYARCMDMRFLSVVEVAQQYCWLALHLLTCVDSA